ncbi:MAG TPA: phosphoglucosamine mutase [Acidimicrobiales bacterium]|nr:phosphoglucosamine mutase [Acidimicrobiales bacterium]
MGRIRFGTDGVRGVANVELTPELVVALGRAIARTITAATFLIGRDTRRSGPMLQAALSAGLASEGAGVVDVGVLPTPALAWLSATRDVPAVVISASHNPFADNGVKLFAAGGAKLDEEVEAAIEDELERILDPSAKGPRSLEGHGVGSLVVEPGLGDSYVDHLVSLVEDRALEGLRLVVDSANGAASELAAGVFERSGAEVVAIGCDPDGTNINEGCGSTATETLSGAVVEHRADLGLALDGDADRLLAVDGQGRVVNGDELLALFALDLADRGQLAGNSVVVTVMTNLGFRLAMDQRGINVKETPVGDRHVLGALDKEGLSLGGEQSGHIIFRRLATTGDGLLTGLVLADLVARAGRPLAALLEGLVTRIPQVLVNVPVPDSGLLVGADAVWSAVAEEEARLGDAGRVLLRPSGTEPVVRVMVEASGDGVAEGIAQRLSTLVGFELRSAATAHG